MTKTVCARVGISTMLIASLVCTSTASANRQVARTRKAKPTQTTRRAPANRTGVSTPSAKPNRLDAAARAVSLHAKWRRANRTHQTERYKEAAHARAKINGRSDGVRYGLSLKATRKEHYINAIWKAIPLAYLASATFSNGWTAAQQTMNLEDAGLATLSTLGLSALTIFAASSFFSSTGQAAEISDEIAELEEQANMAEKSAVIGLPEPPELTEALETLEALGE